ncbi:MAG: hypothetical protein NWE76_06285 [Candidatus Bathyarchaeota archaeon]|nr:hypothetical protein [Candidatus Bathyarchaeota archaeon]
MARVTLTQLQRKLNRRTKNLRREQSRIEQDAAEMTADLIRDRTSRGFGVDKHKAPKKRLKKLSESYIKQRKKEGLTSKSRLTRTGEMLESIYANRGKVTLRGKRNKDVAGWVAEAGRAFFHLSSAEYKRVSEDVKSKVLKILGLS